MKTYIPLRGQELLDLIDRLNAQTKKDVLFFVSVLRSARAGILAATGPAHIEDCATFFLKPTLIEGRHN